MADVTPFNVNLEQFSEYMTPEQMSDHFATMDILRAEAKADGIKCFGEFEERYGVKRLYNLTEQCGGNPNTSTSFTHTAMPYHSGNWEKAEGITLPNFIPIANMKDVRRDLLKVDYSVIEQRREGQQALNNWADQATEIWEDSDTRLPYVIGKSFNDLGCEQTMNLLGSLHSVLEHRPTNVAKDVDQGRKTGRQADDSDSTKVVSEQGSQDNIKRFEELRKTFLKWITGSGRYTTRHL